MYQQLIQPNLSVTGQSGYCLSMQENVWGAEHQYSYAEEAWNAHPEANHPGEQPPGVCVPVYWTYFDTAANTEYGHVATWVPGRGVYSSTFNTAYGAEWYPSIQAMTDRINQIGGANGKYLGWSEVISNVRVVAGEEMDYEDVKFMRYAALHRLPSDDEVKGDLGQKADALAKTYLASPEWLTQNDILLVEYPKALGQIEDLQKQLTAASATPTVINQPLPSMVNNVPTPLQPADQNKVNIFVTLWRAIFG